MLHRQLLANLRRCENYQFVVEGAQGLSYAEFAQTVEDCASGLQEHSGQKIGLFLQDGIDLVTLLFALDKLGCDVFLFGSENLPAFVEASMAELGVSLCITDRVELSGVEKFLVLTGGALFVSRGTLTPALSHPMGEGAGDLRDGVGSGASCSLSSGDSHGSIKIPGSPTPSPIGWERAGVRGGSGYGQEVQPIGTSANSLQNQVVLFTSGTSGKPKGALHTWESLAAGIKVDARFEQSRWLLTYGLTRFAGIQVFLQSFLNNGCLVFNKGAHPSELIQTLISERVEYVSGTPTFWRKLLASAPFEQLRAIPLKQITLGGEIVGQGILNGLRAAFPNAQLTHIYASTEMGVCFAVRDGLEGFPIAYLQQNPDVQMEIREGELYIRSRRAMKTYLALEAPKKEDWFATGDLVESKENRIYFLGRRSEIINVGGSKVYPAEVEEQIRGIAGVRDARVFGTKSSFAGSLVSAEVAVLPGTDTSLLKQAILAHCNSVLAPHKRPRMIQFVDQLKETASKKIARQ